ncbi:MAG TPA: S9 family peptidase, partial [Thermoanaerobaculia bacterium]|nr:S9 family peptidase [Thermoanaerobaculia bacterium]
MPATLRWPALRAAFLSCLMLLAATAVFAASGTVPAAPPASTAKRLIRETDLFRFVWVADPQLSPDGRRVAFVRVSVNAKKDGYDTAIWVAPADGSEPPRPFTSGLHDNAPRWSPSGRLLAFTRTEGAGGVGGSRPQIFLLDTVGGGEAQALTDLPGGATAPAWSPDGRTLAFASATSPADLEKKKAGKKGDEEYESDVRVITTATYRSNDTGYRDRSHPSHLWTVAVPTDPAAQRPEAHPVTAGTLEERNPVWSRDGAFLYYTANRLPEPDYAPQDSDLYAVPVQGGKALKVADIDGLIEGFTPSPDGKRIAFLGALHGGTVRSSDQPDLFVVDLTPGVAPRNLTAGYDFDLGEDLSGDQAAPRGALPLRPVWSRDGGSLYEVAADHGRANLQRI